jgi:hypothetical protein
LKGPFCVWAVGLIFIFKRLATIQINLECGFSQTGLDKRSTYWRPIEPGPKRFATGKIGEVGGSSLGGDLPSSGKCSGTEGKGVVVGVGSGTV